MITPALNPTDPYAVYDEYGNRYLCFSAAELFLLRAHLTMKRLLSNR